MKHFMLTYHLIYQYYHKKYHHFYKWSVDLVILILKIYKCFKMDYVVIELNGLEVVKKRKKAWFIWNKSVFLQPFMINILFKTNRIINIIYISRFSFKSSLTRYISIFKTLDYIYECPHNGQFQNDQILSLKKYIIL